MKRILYIDEYRPWPYSDLTSGPARLVVDNFDEVLGVCNFWAPVRCEVSPNRSWRRPWWETLRQSSHQEVEHLYHALCKLADERCRTQGILGMKQEYQVDIRVDDSNGGSVVGLERTVLANGDYHWKLKLDYWRQGKLCRTQTHDDLRNEGQPVTHTPDLRQAVMRLLIADGHLKRALGFEPGARFDDIVPALRATAERYKSVTIWAQSGEPSRNAA